MQHFINLIGQLRHYKKWVFVSILFQLLTALFTLVSIPFIIPFFQLLFGLSPSSYDIPDNWWEIEKMLNYGFSRLIAISDRRNALAVVSIAVVIIFLLRNIFRFLSSYFLIPARNGIVRDLRSGLFDSYTDLTIADRNQYRKGNLLSMISSDIAEIDHGILKAIELLFKTPFVIVGCLIFMFAINVKLSIIALLLALCSLLIVGRLSHVLKKTSSTIQSSLGDLQSITEEYLGSIKLIKSYNAESFFKYRFDQSNDHILKLSNSALRRRDLASPLSEFLAVGIIAVLLWSGANMVFNSEIEPTTFFAFIFAFYNIIDPAKSFSREYYNVQRGNAALLRIKEFQINNDLSNKITGDKVKTTFDNQIEFQNVTFRYKDDNESILENFNLNISKNKKIGIIGPSGVGKTTLIDLLLRFFVPESGKIIMDGRDIAQYRLNDYRNLFAVVTQDPRLFHMNIAENIALSDHYDLNRVKSALFNAQCNDFINIDQLDEHTVLYDSGDNLSGGQKQRLTIARALYHDPPIVILDEPTSNLDFETEKEVMKALNKLSVQRTVITISHQRDILNDMDSIVELN